MESNLEATFHCKDQVDPQHSISFQFLTYACHIGCVGAELLPAWSTSSRV